MKKIEFETFRELGSFTVSGLTQKEPSSLNGRICVEKYKVTIELVKEPEEVICRRLQDLWDKCDNYHEWEPLENMAKKYNYIFKGEVGNKRLKRD